MDAFGMGMTAAIRNPQKTAGIGKRKLSGMLHAINESNHVAPQDLGEYMSALANGACLRDHPHGYMVFGIEDKTHHIKGTAFDPYTEKGKGTTSSPAVARQRAGAKRGPQFLPLFSPGEALGSDGDRRRRGSTGRLPGS